VLDPDRKKMSKSKGNVVTPIALLDEHGADGVRYWAASGRPGTDTAFDAGQMRVGRRLAIKLLNASRFALGKSEPRGPVTAPLDRGMLTSLATLVADSTEQLDGYNYATVLERAERWFWSFCDDYLELVKSRRYGAQGEALAASANSALVTALSVILRVFAPFLPFVTEEVWSWWQQGSIHRAPWPAAVELERVIGGPDGAGALSLERAALVLGEVRKTKSEAKRPLTTPVVRLVVRDVAAHLEALRPTLPDVIASGFVEQIELIEAEAFGADVTLAPAQG
jgi:valyl-tRNA synthetase